MTNPTPHGQVPEALRLAEEISNLVCSSEAAAKTIAAAADELCRQHARIAELESELAAVGAGGVQALSAAPAGWKLVPVNPTPEMWKAAKSVPDPNPPYPPHYGLVWDAMLAASPTPTAEQQAAPKAAPVEPSDVEIDDFLDSPACITWVIASNRDRYRLLVRAVLAKWAAPQQEAQEPAFWMNEKGHTWSHSDWKQFPKHRAKYPIPLYPHFPAPQPAPACHHRPPCDECAALAAQGGKDA